MRRLLALFLLLALLLAALPLTSVAGAGATVTGTLASKDKTALGAGATAVVILVDQQSGVTGGTVLSTQRIDNARWPVAFAVPYDTSAIDPKHSYALYATVADTTRMLQSILPTPVITGGPTSKVAITVLPAMPTATSSLPGTMTRDDRSALSAQALAIAALVRVDSGTVEAYQIITKVTTEPIKVAIAYDPSLIDPAATYVVRAGIVDGSRTWALPTPAPAIRGGTAVPSVTLKVVKTGETASPTPSATATARPTPSAKPTPTPKPTPTASPTAQPTPSAAATPTPSPAATPTPSPSPAATPTPTPSPAATPTPSPSPAPTASPAPTPSATPPPTASPTPVPTGTPTTTPSPTAPPSATPTGAPTPEPSQGNITGTVTWGENHVPGKDAMLVVSLVDASAGTSAGKVLATTEVASPGGAPVPFTLLYSRTGLAAGDHFRIVAALLDGDLAWLNETGVAVPVPDPVISGVGVPLTFMSDLLKAQVSGIVTGEGLDGSASATSYASVVLVNPGTGQIIGYHAVAPIGGAPIPFVIPYSLADIDPAGDYLVNATAWDGTRMWTGTQLSRVITKGNPTGGVVVPVAAGPASGTRPTSGPIAPGATVPAGPVTTGDGAIGFFGWILLLAAITTGTALLSWSVMELRARNRKRG